MRNVIMFNMLSLDGFFEGPSQEIDWHQVDADFNAYTLSQFERVDTILFGRVTYHLMASFWPTEQALSDDPFVARFMNDTAKIVFSNTLTSADWHNTRLVHGEAADAVARMKNQPGKDLIILGSGKLTASLAARGLIDVFRFMVNPVLLGVGATLFAGLPGRVNLRLLETHTFKNGNVLLAYAPQQ